MNAQRIKDEAALTLTQLITHINEISIYMEPHSFTINQPIWTRNNSSNNNIHKT